jgi:maltose O-acetyltransferase
VSRAIHKLLYFIKGQLVGSIKAQLSGAEHFGNRPVIIGKVNFELNGQASFGDRFQAHGQISTISILVNESATLTVGNDVFLNSGVMIEAWHDVHIGSNVLMAPFSSIIDDDRHPVEPDTILYKGPTRIGNNVWLGRSVSVMPGVTIGDGSVIGAHSIVTRDIPPNSFAVGAPARVSRKLELPSGWVRHGRMDQER